MDREQEQMLNSLNCPEKIKSGIAEYLDNKTEKNWLDLMSIISAQCPCCDEMAACKVYRGIANHILVSSNAPRFKIDNKENIS